MSFNIERWYPVLGPTKTAETAFLPVKKPVALALSALHEEYTCNLMTKDDILSRIQGDPVLSEAMADIQHLISPEGSFMKTSARSCKDIALDIGLAERYRVLLQEKMETSQTNLLDEMVLRSIFMEAGRQVLRFTNAKDFLFACVLSERISGVSPWKTVLTIGYQACIKR